MSRNKTLVKARNNAIMVEYRKLIKVKVGKVQLYSLAAIYEMISQKFFLSGETVADIVIKYKTSKTK